MAKSNYHGNIQSTNNILNLLSPRNSKAKSYRKSTSRSPRIKKLKLSKEEILRMHELVKQERDEYKQKFEDIVNNNTKKHL